MLKFAMHLRLRVCHHRKDTNCVDLRAFHAWRARRNVLHELMDLNGKLNCEGNLFPKKIMFWVASTACMCPRGPKRLKTRTSTCGCFTTCACFRQVCLFVALPRLHSGQVFSTPSMSSSIDIASIASCTVWNVLHSDFISRSNQVKACFVGLDVPQQRPSLLVHLRIVSV